jgi:P-type Ca2+ transporter type 2B
MATIDGRPAQYGISLKVLREVMETRGREGMGKIHELGGTLEICKKLYTSPNNGMRTLFLPVKNYLKIILK